MTQVKGLEWSSPHIAPQGHEVQAVAEILDGGAFKDTKAYVRKTISAILALVTRRNWYAVAHRNRLGTTLWGLFATESAAQKAIDTNSLALLVEDGDQLAVFEVRSLGQRDEYLRAQWAAQRHGCSRDGCGHTAEVHGGKTWRACNIANCPCPGYEAPAYDLPPITNV